MRIQGLQKLTLLDYPGRTACTVFLSGCNFRCPFCHNAPLLTAADEDGMDEDELLAFLKKRQGLLDGVAVTGGEPLLRPELPALLEKVKALGYAVKLDTNGTFPERLEAIVRTGLADCACIKDTTSEESTPPDRNAPNGTSATICRPTASSSNRSSASVASASLPAKGSALPACARSAADQ